MRIRQLVSGNEGGVALVTVLFVGMVLTVASSAAIVMTTQDFRAMQSDRRGSEAMAIAEAGVDRFVFEVRRGTYSRQQLAQAGCEDPPLTLPAGLIGNGNYTAQLTVYDPQPTDPAQRVPPAACLTRPAAGEPAHYSLIATGARVPQGSRTIQQIIRVSHMSVPLGVFAQRVDANGNTNFRNTSLISTGDVIGREKLGFFGLDAYYTLRNFYGPAASPTTKIPAAAHAIGGLYIKSAGRSIQEHPPSPNCTANSRGDAGQSLWDGSVTGGAVTSGCPGQTGQPPTSEFVGLYDANGRPVSLGGLTSEQYASLREVAQLSGIYCTGASVAPMTCTKGGVATTISTDISDAVVAGLPNSFVVYIDLASSADPFAKASTIKWKAGVGPCSDVASTNRSVVVIVRNGSVDMNGAPATINGMVVAPEGLFDSSGSYTVTGPVTAKELRLRGTGTFQLNDCWLRNPPSALTDVTLSNWREIDR